MSDLNFHISVLKTKSKRIILKTGVFTLLSFLVGIAMSCSSDEKGTIQAIKNPDAVPTLLTTKVSTLISDSGITRYKLVTDLWAMYENRPKPYWSFTKGIYIEKFDSLMRPEASIKADYAFFLKMERIWILKKNVKIKNLKGEEFTTEELYWDQNSKKIYSRKFIRIKQLTRTICGKGFVSNESMSQYYVKKNYWDMYVDESAQDTIN